MLTTRMQQASSHVRRGEQFEFPILIADQASRQFDPVEIVGGQSPSFLFDGMDDTYCPLEWLRMARHANEVANMQFTAASPSEVIEPLFARSKSGVSTIARHDLLLSASLD